MPASILQGIFEVILQAILEVVCYYVGRIVVPVVSFGRFKCDKFLADTPRRKWRWSRAYHCRGGQVYLSAEATAVVGFLVITLVVAGGSFFWLRHSD